MENPNLHNKFKNFWASVPEGKRHVKLGTIFRNAQVSAPRSMDELCGDARACSQFFVTGRCVRECHHHHDPQHMLQDAKCNKLIEVLKRGLANS